MSWFSEYAKSHNEDNSYMNPHKKHFYYTETIIDKRGNILTACGIHVSTRNDVDLQEPTCEICKNLKEEYDNLRIE